MQLYQLTTSALGQLKQSVREIRAVKLYYWYRGRNAWWGIWATHYFDGSLHTDIESAKKFIEGKRTQGSVFYIRQLPAMLLVCDRVSVAITQINSKLPLCEYTYTPNSAKSKEAWRKDFGIEKVALSLGAPLGSVVQSFEPLSSFWFKTPKAKDSVVAVCASGSEGNYEELNDEELLQWKSVALGQSYLLGWSIPKPNGVTQKAVRNLVFLANCA